MWLILFALYVAVLWVLVITACGVESSSSRISTSGLDTIYSQVTEQNLGHYTNQQAADDQSFQSHASKLNKDIDNLNHGKITRLSEKNEGGNVPKEKNTSYELNGDEVKSKHNKQQKFSVNFKNYSIGKLVPNESNNEKQKSNLSGSLMFKNNNFKKDFKLSPDNSDQILKSNLSYSTVPGSFKLQNGKLSQITEFDNNTTDTNHFITGDIKMNETNVMSDQPAPIDTQQNVTYVANDDSLYLFPDNTSKLFQVIFVSI